MISLELVDVYKRQVLRRVSNMLMLYTKQKILEGMVTEQIIDKEKNNFLMVEILSNIVEFRNGESGLHVLHIRVLSLIHIFISAGRLYIFQTYISLFQFLVWLCDDDDDDSGTGYGGSAVYYFEENPFNRYAGGPDPAVVLRRSVFYLTDGSVLPGDYERAG